MSPAPESDVSILDGARYEQAWIKISKLSRGGVSWSGHERNCCFLNTGGPRFADVSAAGGLDLIDDGRAVGITDWDQDGDLDAWIVNRAGPQVRFLRNNNSNGNHWVSIQLVGRQSNRDAIGARLELKTAGTDARLTKTIRAGNGFLAQSSKRVHFGLPRDSQIEELTVRWPSGAVERFADVHVDQRYKIIEGTGVASPATDSPRAVRLAAAPLEAAKFSNDARIVFSKWTPLPSSMPFHDLAGIPRDVNDQITGPRLIVLWSGTCRACLLELREIAQHQEDLRRAGLDVVALAAPPTGGDVDADRLGQQLSGLGYDFTAGVVTDELVKNLDLVQRAFLMQRRPLQVPTSFLIDAEGNVSIVYRGRVSVPKLLTDVQLLQADQFAKRDASAPLKGRWKPRQPSIAQEPNDDSRYR